MKNFKYTKQLPILLIIGVGIFAGSLSNTSFANEVEEAVIEKNEEKDLRENQLPNYDIASADELKAYDEDNFTQKALDFGKNYQSRLNLLILLKELEKIENIEEIIDMNHYYIVLNDALLDSNEINKQKDNLLQIISLNKIELNNVLSNEEISNSEDDTLNYIYKGILFDNSYNNDDVSDNLRLLYNSISNSRDYYEADIENRQIYEIVLLSVDNAFSNPKDKKSQEDLYNYLLEFAKSDDKMNFDKEYKISSKNENKENLDNKEELETQIQMYKNNNLLSNNEKKEYDSPFFKNEATKNEYISLSDSQKKELDLLDNNHDGILTDEEINKSDNYQTPIPEDMRLYPFTEEKKPNSSLEIDYKDDDDNKNDNDDKEEETNTKEIENNKVPKSVRISENKETTTTDKDNTNKTTSTAKPKTQTPIVKTADKPKTNTVSKENVKTGVDSLGIVVAILVVAIIGYLLTKKMGTKK